MKVVVCDDNMEDLEKIKGLLTKYREINKDVQLETKEGLISIPYSRIEYIENYSRRLNICLTDGKNIQSIFIRKSFNEETQQIAENDSFIQVHKSFLVNLYHVDKLMSGNIIMESGARFPISKARTADVKKNTSNSFQRSVDRRRKK